MAANKLLEQLSHTHIHTAVVEGQTPPYTYLTDLTKELNINTKLYHQQGTYKELNAFQDFPGPKKPIFKGFQACDIITV